MAEKLTAGVLVAFALLLTSESDSFAQNKCSSTKIKAAGKKAACLLGLEAKEAKSGTPPAADKLAKCTGKFSSTFTKAEAKGSCLTTGDVADIEAKVDAFVDDVDTELGVGGVNGCQASKLKAAGKKAKCLLGLEAKEAAKGIPPPADKVAKCTGKFSSTFSKAEAKGDCATTGDALDIEDKVEAFVIDVDSELQECFVEFDPCGNCGDGFCGTRFVETTFICVSSASCSTTGCVSDGDCASGEVCIAVPGPNICCLPCP